MFIPERAPLYGLPQATITEWEIVTPPASAFVIAMDEVKTFLNIPIEDKFFDPEKQGFLITAQKAIEQYCHLSLLEMTWVGHAPAFFDEMRIIRRPFKDVTKVEYVDYTTGEITTLDPSCYIVGRAAQKCGSFSRAAGVSWPRAAERWDAVRITATCGWDKTKVPDEIRNAILQTIAALDHQRADDNGSSSGGVHSVYALKHQQAPSLIPLAAQAMLSKYKYFGVVVG